MEVINNNTLLDKIKCINWNRVTDIVVIVYLTKLVFNGYSGHFQAYGKGAELEEILRAIFITSSYIATLLYVLLAIRKKLYLAGSIALACSLPILLFGLLYYSFADFVEAYRYDVIQSLFWQFTCLQSWLCIHGFSQVKNNPKIQHGLIVILVLILIFSI